MPLQPGTLLHNRYRIDRILGHGGMGAVYLATDENFNLPVAVKANLNLSADSERHFKREATLLAALRHPHLPRVTNHFVLGGEQYLVMDYVEGEDLKQRVDRVGAFTENEALRWITQICDALAYLHAQNPLILHRDIKPANIKLNAQGEAILVDFGIARATGVGAQQTSTGAVAATSGYAPPEQYGMAQLGPAADIYALAATLYHLLTGRVPPDSMERLLGTAPLDPILHIRPNLAHSIANALERALAIKPEDRFENAAQFKAALLGQPVSLTTRPAAVTTAPPEGAARPLSTPRKRRISWPLILGFAFIACLAVGSIALAFLSTPLAGQLLGLTTPTARPATSIANVTSAPPTVTASPTALPELASATSAPATSTPRPTVTPTPGFTPLPIELVNVSGLALQTEWPFAAAASAQFAFSPDGGTLALYDEQGVNLYDVQTGELTRQLQGFVNQQRIQAVTYFSADALMIQMPDELYQWDIAQNMLIERYRFVGDDFELSADKRRLAIHESFLTLIDLDSGRLLNKYGSGKEPYPYPYALSPDGAHLALGIGNFVEWRSLDTGAVDLTFSGHGETIGQLIFTADGSRLVSASGDVWDTQTGERVSVFDSATRLVTVSPDGQLIVGADGSVWELASGKFIEMLPGLSGSAQRLAFTPDGLTLVWQTGNDTVQVWQTDGAASVAQVTPTPITPVGPQRDAITLSNAGQLALLGWVGRDELLSARQQVDGALKTALVAEAVTPADLDVNPSDGTAAYSGGSGVSILSLANGQIIDSISGVPNPGELAYLGDFILVANGRGQVERWDLRTHQQKQIYDVAGQGLVTSPASDLFVLQDKYVQVVEVLTGKVLHKLGAGGAQYSYRFTPDGKYLALTSGQAVGLWDVVTGQRAQNLAGHGPRTAGLIFSADGQYLISASGDIWDWQAGGAPVVKFDSTATAIAISPDGTLLVGNEGTLWNAQTGERLGKLIGLRGLARKLRFTPDGQYLLWQTSDGVVTVWGIPTAPPPTPTAVAPASNAITASNAANLQLQARWGKGRLLSARWSPDGKRLLVSTTYNAIVYDSQSLKPLAVYWGGRGLALGANGLVAVADAANGLRVLNVDSAKTLLTLPYTNTVVGVFSADGSALVVGGQLSPTTKADGLALIQLADGAVTILNEGKGTFKAVRDLALAPDGQMLVASFTDVIGFWDTTTGKRPRGFISGAKNTASLSADGTRVAYLTGKVVVETIASGGLVRAIPSDGVPPFPASYEIDPYVLLDFDFLPDGTLLTFYRTKRGGLLDVARWTVDTPGATLVMQRILALDSLGTFYADGYKADKSNLPVFALDPTGSMFYSLTSDGVMRVWNAESGKLLAASPSDYTGPLALSPNGQTVLQRNLAGELDAINLSTGAVQQTLNIGPVPDYLVYLNDTVLLLTYNGAGLSYFDVQRNTRLTDDAAYYAGDPAYFAHTANAHLLAGWDWILPARARSSLNLYGLAPGAPLYRLGAYTKRAPYAFTPDEQHLAVVTGNKVDFWNTTTGALDKTLVGTAKTLGALFFTRDGSRLVSATGEIWAMDSGQLLTSFAPGKTVTTLALSPDGSVIVGNDGSVWQTDTGTLLTQIPGFLGPARSVQFTRDGRSLIWQTADGVLEVWGMK